MKGDFVAVLSGEVAIYKIPLERDFIRKVLSPCPTWDPHPHGGKPG